MTNGERFSEEILNAYVDGELDADERLRIQEAMQHDAHLRERVEELHSLKRLVRNAYVDEVPSRARRSLTGTWNVTGVAASIAAFALGVALTWGWLTYTDGPSAPRVAALPDQEQSAVVDGSPAKVVFHLSSADPAELDEVLAEADALLSATSSGGDTALVKVIASGAALTLFEKGSAPAGGRISAMKDRFPEHLVFNGCGVAYKQLKALQNDGEFEMMPELQLVDLGVLELMRRQRDGWAYIRL